MASRLRVLGLLQHGLGDGAVFVEVLGAEIRLVVQLLVVHGLEVGIEGVGDVGALHLKEELAFFHVVVEARLDIDNTAVGERDDGISREISGNTAPVTLSSSGSFDALGGDGGVLLGIGDFDDRGVADLRDLRRRGGACGRIEIAVAAGRGQSRLRAKKQEWKKTSSLNHLAADSEIELPGGGKIRADELQIGKLDLAIIALRVEHVEKGSAAVLVGVGDGVAHARRLVLVFVAIRLKQRDGGFKLRVG